MGNLSDLKHTTRVLPHGGEVIVIDTGAKIGPESLAMLQALHSRSLGGIKEHLKMLAEKGSERFMGTYYVGYNHKSIGDCGTIVIFIEGVSMLVAKAIQDWPLYSGQEASTRYIDFAEQPFIDPVGSDTSHALLKGLRSLYLEVLDVLNVDLVRRYPRKEGEKESIYEKAIKARAFDIARSLLPAGASTNLAWATSLRQCADKLMLLRHHPLPEVKEVAEALEDAVLEACPNSFGHKQYDATESYNEEVMGSYLYDPRECPESVSIASDGIDRELLREDYGDLLKNRPVKTEPPKHLAECGTLRFEFPLDFGSFRDLQRQRAVTQRMPLMTDRHGFDSWYLNELPEATREKVVSFLNEYADRADTFDLLLSPEMKQYYTPMGYRLPNRLTGNLHALVYLVELRASSTVHPTLQIVAHQMADLLRDNFGPYGLKVYTDGEPGRFDVRRGKQDIVKVE